jgi:hypothetical protein
MRLSRCERRTEDGFVYHELTFNFDGGKKTKRYVTDDLWRARFSDARSVYVIWAAVRSNRFKQAPVQGDLF